MTAAARATPGVAATSASNSLSTGPVLWRDARIATLADGGWGLIERGALVSEGGAIAWVGPEAALPPALAARVQATQDLGGALVTPGLVDCHTHLVYGGQRAGEFEQRLQGVSYEEIARAGGGIRSSVAATRAADDASLFASAARRARCLMAEGVRGPRAVAGYGKGLLSGRGGEETAGHNPLGGWSVAAMLAALATQAVTGLFLVQEDYFFEGPLAKHVSRAVSDRLNAIHEWPTSA